MNAHFMAGEGVPITVVIPKEGAMLGIDTVAIMKGSKQAELAYKFIDTILDPEIQAEMAKIKKGCPWCINAKVIRRSRSYPASSPPSASGRARPSSSTTSCAPRRPPSGANGSPRTS